MKKEYKTEIGSFYLEDYHFQPKDGEVVNGKVIVENKCWGTPCRLNEEALGVYDYIIGCQICQDWNSFHIGMEWFRINYPKEYMILLD